MKLGLNLNQIKIFKTMCGLKWILFFSVLFLMINTAHGNSPRAISGKDSLIIIFKGPTLQSEESKMNNISTKVLSVISNETLIDHFQPLDKVENAENTRWYAMNRAFAPNNSSFFQHTNGILNFGKCGNSNRNVKRDVKEGISE
jgi:hypothetical protein